MGSREVYEKKISEYEKVIKEYIFFINLFPEIKGIDRILSMKLKNNLIESLKYEEEIYMKQKIEFIKIFKPLLKDDLKFEKEFIKFLFLEKKILEKINNSSKKRENLLKKLEKKVQFLKKINFFSQKILEILLISILINSFINIIYLNNQYIFFLGGVVIGLLAANILTATLYKNIINRIIIFFDKKIIMNN